MLAVVVANVAVKGNTILSGDSSAVVSDLLGARLKAVFSKLFRRLLRRPG
jgi:hypothetical protein